MIASIDGLKGLTIGKLSAEIGMSKSGLFSHFGSKENLQLATIEKASEIFVKNVISPAEIHTPGLERLKNLVNNWITYAENKVFPGGCFFSTTSIEFDSIPGIIKDKIAEIMKSWLARIENEIEAAKKNNEIDKSVNTKELAFKINSIAMGSNWASQLFDDMEYCRMSKKIIEEILDDLKN